MKAFKDNQNREWRIAINVASISKVKDLIGVNLLEAVESDLVQKLACDPVLLCNVIYCLCQEEAREAGVSDESFGAAMAGDSIDAATEALLSELCDFFPKDRRRLLRAAVQKMGMLLSRAADLGEKKLDLLAAQSERDLRAQLQLPPEEQPPAAPSLPSD